MEVTLVNERFSHRAKISVTKAHAVCDGHDCLLRQLVLESAVLEYLPLEDPLVSVKAEPRDVTVCFVENVEMWSVTAVLFSALIAQGVVRNWQSLIRHVVLLAKPQDIVNVAPVEQQNGEDFSSMLECKICQVFTI